MDPIVQTPEITIYAMVISIGGTPAPIIKSIQHYKPQFISFLASQDTSDNVADIKRACREENLTFKSEITVVENVNDLLHCFEKASEAVMRVVSKEYHKDDVVTDYTGGTKNMSVSLALAAINHGFAFSYVGGSMRTKNGVGIVVDGAEAIYNSVNPWDFLAIEEKKRIALLFNQYQFMAAKQLCNALSEKSTRYRSMFKKVGFLIEGYYFWDLFRHKEAHDRFQRAKIEEIQEADDVAFKKFAEKTTGTIPFLKRLVNENRGALIPSLLLDLFANAQRRFEESRIDDAILRLYRVMEMIAQERLLSKYGIDTSDVTEEKIPDSLRERFANSYRNRDNKIKVPQNAAFEFLAALGDEVGKAFEENRSQFLNIQTSRNQSYLAHGFGSSKERTYVDLRDFVVGLEMFRPDDAPVFPKFEI